MTFITYPEIRFERNPETLDWTAFVEGAPIGTFRYYVDAKAAANKAAYPLLLANAPHGISFPEPDDISSADEADKTVADLQAEAWDISTEAAKCGGWGHAPRELRERHGYICAVLYTRRLMAQEDAERAERVYARPADPQPQAVYVATAEEPEPQPDEPQMPTYDELYAFIKRWYKHERFEARNEGTWCPDYSRRIVISYMEDLLKQGNGLISCHESVTGQALWFNRSLKFFEPWQGFLRLPFEQQAVEANQEGVGQDLPC